LIEDEEIAALQKFDVFAHQPRMIGPFDRDSTQESKQGLREPVTEEILPSCEIYEGKRWVKDILREIGGYTNEKRIIHGRMVRNEKHPFPSPRDITPSPTRVKLKGNRKNKKERMPAHTIATYDAQTLNRTNIDETSTISLPWARWAAGHR
jgi:hypothetical protein